MCYYTHQCIAVVEVHLEKEVVVVPFAVEAFRIAAVAPLKVETSLRNYMADVAPPGMAFDILLGYHIDLHLGEY